MDTPGAFVLETERLLLREFNEADTQAFYALGSDARVMRFLGDPLRDLEHAREVLHSRPMADYRKHGFGRLACVLKTSGEVIGFSGLKYLDDLQEVDLGYRLLPAFWGRGLATEAARAVLDDGFSRLKIERILGLVDPANTASMRVLEKVGLRYIGMMEYWGKPTAKYLIERKDACPANGSPTMR